MKSKDAKHPYWIWIFLAILAVSILGMFKAEAQCNFASIYQAAEGDTVFCNYGAPSGSHNNPAPVPGEENIFFLDWTRLYFNPDSFIQL